MNAHESINSLARQAFEHWGAGRLDEAVAAYLAALGLMRDHGWPASPDLHAQLAGVLDVQGRLDEAITQSELALAAERARDGASDASTAVKVARHFLADRWVRQGQPGRALDVLAPALAALPDDWLLNLTQAEALFADGQVADAAAAARHALAQAPSDDKRAQLAERLAAVLRG